jgi:hypothetical protein
MNVTSCIKPHLFAKALRRARLTATVRYCTNANLKSAAVGRTEGGEESLSE